MIGGMPQGRPSKIEESFQFTPEGVTSRMSKETNTLLIGPEGRIRDSGKGRPRLELPMDFSGAEGSASEVSAASSGDSYRLARSGATVMSPLVGDIRQFF